MITIPRSKNQFLEDCLDWNTVLVNEQEISWDNLLESYLK
jgi:hypothetical protein